MPDPVSLITTLAGVADTAIAALKRDEVAQQIATKGRVDAKIRRDERRWTRLVKRAADRLAKADAADNEEQVVAALLELHALGVDEDTLVWAVELGKTLGNDGE